MPLLLLLRHGQTSWNLAHRIQGRSDIAITAHAAQQLSAIGLSAAWRELHWLSSPLLRARQTVQQLGIEQFTLIPELIEMNWGEFEGLTLNQVETEIVQQRLTPDSGLDLTPPGGESPRMVRDRLAKWLVDYATCAQPGNTIAVTHKGVIRAALSLATGWTMEKRFSVKINWHQPIGFHLDNPGSLRLIQANCDFADNPEQLLKIASA